MTSTGRPGVLLLLVLVAVGAGLVGGVFFAFSGFVLRALVRAPGQVGAVAMREVNVAAVRPPLMLLLFGTALAEAALLVLAVLGRGVPLAGVVGAVLYLVGAVVVTVVGNVPLNERLARAGGEELAGVWRGYAARWSAWNHVRTLACAAACLLAVLAASRV
ncbi:hypothetical protein NUM3379_41370 [Kineococcus sp. NUM-3379]